MIEFLQGLAIVALLATPYLAAVWAFRHAGAPERRVPHDEHEGGGIG